MKDNNRQFIEIFKERFSLFLWALVITLIVLGGYWLVQRTIEPKFDFSIALDSRIPFIHWTIWIYLSDLLFFSFAALALTRKEFIQILQIILIAYVISMIGFIFLPGDYPRIEVTTIASPFYRWGYGVFHTVDLANNTFPSMHVGLTWIICISLARRFQRYKYIIFAYSILVTLSVLTTKQHFILDIVGGLTVVFISLNLHRLLVRWRTKNRVETKSVNQA
jgi:PAP2 superfamily